MPGTWGAASGSSLGTGPVVVYHPSGTLFLEVLRQCATELGACRLLRLRWEEVRGIRCRAAQRGLARKRQRLLPVIGVDKKAFKKEVLPGLSWVDRCCIKNPRGGDSDAERRPLPTHFKFGKTLVCQKSGFASCRKPLSGLSILTKLGGLVQNADRNCPGGIIRKRRLGAWTCANFRRICMQGFPGLNTWDMGCCKWQFPGHRSGRGLPSLWNGLLSTSSHRGRT
jgi:hypothetical protein